MACNTWKKLQSSGAVQSGQVFAAQLLWTDPQFWQGFFFLFDLLTLVRWTGVLGNKWTVEIWSLFKGKTNFQASFSCTSLGGRNKRTKERYGELGKPLKLCLNYTFLALPVPGDAAICVFFYSAWLARSQAELNACLWPQEDDASVSLCQPGGP